MNRLRWSLSLLAGLLFVSGASLQGSTGPGAVVVDVGPAATSGTIQFTLNGPDGSGAALNVQVSVSAGDSAASIAAKIVQAVSSSGGVTWSAQAGFASTAGAVSFAYNAGMGYLPVTHVTGLSNSAGALMYIGAESPGTISLIVNGNSMGGPASSLTLQVNGISQAYFVRLSGQTASQIVDGIDAYLSGVPHQRISPNRIDLNLNSGHSALNIITNDPGLQGKVTLSEVSSSACGRGGTDKNPEAQ